jgi:hypothetical protein
MATSVLPARYKINGILDTKVPVMSNLETLCNSCGSFMSYDIHTGEWSVVINTTGSSVKLFNNSNIIGPIQVSGTSLQNLYNRVRVEFPLRDTSDGTDYIEIVIPDEDRYPNEPDNTLQITLQMCNEPVQATIIGLIELKQSRIDQIVTFISDYSTLSLNAGDIITVTNDIYQFSAKPFRIISLKEVDTESGSIQIEITALAYDSNVYSTADLGRFIRTDRNGIVGIGSISAPITPVIYSFAQDVRPGIVIETVVPAGIVESMEFWVSTDNTNFVLVGTEVPTGGGTFASGDTVTLEYNQVASSNYFVKTRGMNSTTAGPFSPVVSLIAFVPVQTTAAIKDGSTTLLNSSGGSLATALGIATLVNKVGAAFGSNSSAKLSEAVFSQAGFPNTRNIMVSDAAGKQVVNGLAPMASLGDNFALMGSNVTFTASQTATYKVECIIDQNSSGAVGGRGPTWSEDNDYVAVIFELYDNVTNTVVANSGSGGSGAFGWTDFALSDVVSLVTGRSYTLKFYYKAYTESNPTTDASFDISYNCFTISP